MSTESRVEIGSLFVDGVTQKEALDRIDDLVRAGEGGAVFTPNVDHVVLAHEDPRMRAAYARVSLSLPDGMPLLWAARWLRTPLPERVSGSDLVEPLLERAVLRGWRVYFLGGAAGVAELARDRALLRNPGLQVVGVDAPRIDINEPLDPQVLGSIRASSPQLVLVALGAPKQEIWIDQVRSALQPAVLIGVGASLDFLAGIVPRAPRWMSRSGLEWLYRLGREPRRLFRRYLLRDPKFFVIVAEMRFGRRTERGHAVRRS